MEEIDLDCVNISPAAYQAWQEIAKRVAIIASQLHIESEEIPDEKARVEDDGSLSVFVQLSIGDVSLRVPPGQWERRFPKN